MKVTIKQASINVILDLTEEEFYQLAAIVGANPAPEFGHRLWRQLAEAKPGLASESQYTTAYNEIKSMRR